MTHIMSSNSITKWGLRDRPMSEDGGTAKVACLGWFVGFTLGLLSGSEMVAAEANTLPMAGVSNSAATATLEPTWGVGAWIWNTNAFAKQTCRFWQAFEIPKNATVASARFRITADNGFRFLLDGREIGRGSDWRSMTEYDLTWLLGPGRGRLQ